VNGVIGKEAQQADQEMRRNGAAYVPKQTTSSPGAGVSARGNSQATADDDLSPYPPARTGSDPRATGTASAAAQVRASKGAREREHDPQADAQAAIAAEMQKREAQSFFAPVVVVDNRPGAKPEHPATADSGIRPQDPAPRPSNPTIAFTGTPATQPSLAAPLPDTPGRVPNTGHTGAASADDTPTIDHASKSKTQNLANNATGPAYKLFEGVVIDAVLTNRLNGTYTGPVNCMVTVDVWSHDRQHLLIPQGSRLLGEAHRVSTTGQQRLAVAFHRIVMPDGYSVSLDKFTGMNQIGETGLKDKVDHHYRQIFGVSVALGAIAGFSAHNASYGVNQSGMDAWRQGFSQSISQEATQILDRYLNILPTVLIREGTRVEVYLTDDLLMPAYNGHRMPSDL
jgi:type IV secretion system protein VirB10